MGRQKGDGRGRLGGRGPGTPNKNNPLKGYLKAHSLEYFKPRPQINQNGEPRKNGIGIPIIDKEGKPVIASDFEMDLLEMEPADRANLEVRLLKYHTPEMKSVDVDLDVSDVALSLEGKLRHLMQEENDN